MRLHPRSVLVAAALIAPAAALAAGCGVSDGAPSPPAATAAAPSVSAAPAARPSTERLLRDVVAAGSPGAIALVNDGRGVHVRAAGVADRHSRRALRPGDRFRAGSITKSFVATVALQLVGEQRLGLSDTVEHWLPGVLPYGDRVTVRQLLNLTSGVPDNQDAVVGEWLKGNMTRSWSPRELVALVARKRPDFAPGTSWAYSNTNYTLAGMVIERVTGRSLGSELDRRILAPLHMRHTAFPVNTTRIAGRHMNGYAVLGREVRDVTVLNPSGTWAAGNLVSTADDIARFWRALLGGRLLAPPQLTAMKTTVPAFGQAHIGYGLGIMASPSPCGTLWGNGGDIAGYTNVFQNTEDGRRQAAVIVDVDPAPEALGEPRGHLRQWSMAAALRRSEPC